MNEIQMTAKLYDMSDTAKKFFGVKYKEAIIPYQTLMLEYMNKSGKSELEAAIELVQLESVKDNAMGQMMIFAAAVDLINNPNKK
jgi:hypothetical protein